MANNEPQGRLYTHPDDVLDVDDDEDYLALDDDEDYLALDDEEEEEEEEEDDDDEGEEEEDDYEEEEEEEEEDDEEDGEEETEGEENLNSNSRSRVLLNTGSDVATTSSWERDEVSDKEEEKNTAAALKEESGGEEWNTSEMDGLFCPICMEAWTSGGDHQVCCLPCGHIYGMSCIKKWLQYRRSSGKCPQCNSKSTLKDIRVLYASRVVAVDEELQKKVRSLEARCTSLELKRALLSGAGSTGAGGSQGGDEITNDDIIGCMRMLIAKVQAMENRWNARFDYLDGRLDQLNGHLDRLDGRLDRLDGRFGRVEGSTSESNTRGTVQLDMLDNVIRGIHDMMPPDQ